MHKLHIDKNYNTEYVQRPTCALNFIVLDLWKVKFRKCWCYILVAGFKKIRKKLLSEEDFEKLDTIFNQNVGLIK